MTTLEFIANIVRSVVWPLVVLVLLVLFRQSIRAVLRNGLRRLKAGPIEAEWDATEAQAAAAISPGEIVKDDVTPLAGDAADRSLLPKGVGESYPALGVLQAYHSVLLKLDSLVEFSGAELNLRNSRLRNSDDSARALIRAGVLPEEMLPAISSLRKMRNLAAHWSGQISKSRAASYTELARELLSALDAIEKLYRRNNGDDPDD